MSESSEKKFTGARPVSREAEIGFLAACVNGDTGAAVVASAQAVELEARDFAEANHRILWRVVSELAEAGLPTDEVSVMDRLHSTPGEQAHSTLMDEIGGVETLLRILEQVELTAHAPHYLGLIKQKSLQRQVIQQAEALLKAAKAPATDFEAVSEKISPALAKLAELGSIEQEESTRDVLNDLRALQQKRLAGESTVKDEAALVEWPVPVMRERISPLDPNEMDFLTVVCGESSHGKSALVAQLAWYNIVHRQSTGLMFLLETTRRRVLGQMCAQQAGVNLREDLQALQNDPTNLRWHGDGHTRVSRFFEAMDWAEAAIDNDRLHMREQTYNLAHMCQTARLLHRKVKGGLRFIVVDYLQEMHREEEDDRLRSDEILGRHVRGLKRLAKQLHVPVICISSLNRGSVDPKTGPTMKSLRGSGDIEFAADRVMAVHRPTHDMNDNEQTEERQVFQVFVNTLKDRAGQRGMVWMQFHPKTTTFFSPPPKEYRGRGHKKET